MSVTILTGDVRDRLKELPDESVHCAVSSPPYFRQRDYGMAGQLGQEDDPCTFAESIVGVFDDVRRTLVPDGVLWLQLGDSYAAGGNGGGGSLARRRVNWRGALTRKGWRSPPEGYQAKDILSLPFLVADLFRASGWVHRSTIIWDKTLASEPARLDRPPVSHEYLFLLSKSKTCRVRDPGEAWFRSTVWQIKPQREVIGHPAVMPAELARRCIICSSSRGEMILDPFGGSGTTGVVADGLQRHAILIELNPEYVKVANGRTQNKDPLFDEAIDGCAMSEANGSNP